MGTVEILLGVTLMDNSPIQGSIAIILSLFKVWKPGIISGLFGLKIVSFDMNSLLTQVSAVSYCYFEFSNIRCELKKSYIWVSMYLARSTNFTSPTGDGTTILRGHPSHTKV